MLAGDWFRSSSQKKKIVSNVKWVDAICEVCYQQFLIDHMEPKINADKDVRNTTDKVCQMRRCEQS